MRRPLALVVLAAVVLAACGRSAGPQQPRAQYERRGNAICARYTKAIGELGQPAKLSDLGPYITKAVPLLARTVGELGRLAPPEGGDAANARFLGAARAALARARALRAAAGQADGAEVQRLLGEAARQSGTLARAARATGLDACALS